MQRPHFLFFLILLFVGGLVSCTKQANSYVSQTPSSFTEPTIKPTRTTPPTATVLPLPQEIRLQIIDGVHTEAKFHQDLGTWVWQNKLGEIRRLMDPLSGHLLVKTTSMEDRLSYEIDLNFLWEVNLVNYIHYAPHAPFGSSYIQLLKNKYPDQLQDGNDETGIVFRILQGNLAEFKNKSKVIYSSDGGTPEEKFFLSPTYNPDTNEYTFTMIISTDFLTKKGALNTYTEWMLNYCTTGEYPPNPSGAWGIQLYKHPIKN